MYTTKYETIFFNIESYNVVLTITQVSITKILNTNDKEVVLKSELHYFLNQIKDTKITTRLDQSQLSSCYQYQDSLGNIIHAAKDTCFLTSRFLRTR